MTYSEQLQVVGMHRGHQPLAHTRATSHVQESRYENTRRAYLLRLEGLSKTGETCPRSRASMSRTILSCRAFPVRVGLATPVGASARYCHPRNAVDGKFPINCAFMPRKDLIHSEFSRLAVGRDGHHAYPGFSCVLLSRGAPRRCRCD